MVPRPVKSAPTFKSAEVISDSDDVSTSSSSSSSDDSDSDQKPKATSPSVTKKAPLQNGTPAPKRKLESAGAPATPATPSSVAKRVKFDDATKAGDGSSSSSSSEDEQNDEDAVESSGEESDGDSDASSSSDPSEGDVNGTSVKQANGKSKSTTSVGGSQDATEDGDSEQIARLPYTPPPGYNKVKSAPQRPRHANIFYGASLEGKEIWHITAPSSLPLAEVERLAGEGFITHNNTRYNLQVGHASDKLRVLLPDQQLPGAYSQLKVGITHSINLAQDVSIPDTAMFPINRQEAETPDVNVHNVRPAIPQPAGLRTRWWPTGFEDNKVLPQTQDSASREASKHKHKKKSHEHRQHIAADEDVEMNGHSSQSPSDDRKKHKKHKKRPDNADDVETPRKASHKDGKTKEEKKRRKKHKELSSDDY